MILFIHPPVSKPTEPPAGLARLAGFLRQQGQQYRIIDANLEGLLFLGDSIAKATDTWSIRASRNVGRNIQAIRTKNIYSSLDRYKRAVLDLNRMIEVAGGNPRIVIGLANYQDQSLSPLKSQDLLRSAENFQENPFFAYFAPRLTECIERESPDWIGFSLNYLHQAVTTLAMIGFIKQRFPAVPIIVGGGLITSWLSHPHWSNPFAGLIDYLIGGPGELTLLELLTGQKLASPILPATPDYSALPLPLYLAPGTILPYSASSGCYWQQCTFCPELAEGNGYRPLPPEKVRHDVTLLREQHQPILLHLLDNALSPRLLRHLIQNPPGLPWYGFSRITSHLEDLDFCRALARSGCVLLKLGIESGDQEVLDQMEKGISLEAVSTVLKNLKKAGIRSYVYLLFGTPWESSASAFRTLDFTRDHQAEIDFLNVAIFNMPLLGPDVSKFEPRGFYSGDLCLYTDFVHPLGWDRKKVRHFLDHTFKKEPVISAILKRDPPIFTSNHAALCSW
jgi:hypothetical protein